MILIVFYSVVPQKNHHSGGIVISVCIRFCLQMIVSIIHIVLKYEYYVWAFCFIKCMLRPYFFLLSTPSPSNSLISILTCLFKQANICFYIDVNKRIIVFILLFIPRFYYYLSNPSICFFYHSPSTSHFELFCFFF